MRTYVDTESMNFVAPTMLIQYSFHKDVILHEIFNNTVRSTLELITSLMEDTLIFYNASHDAFHLTKTFNILWNLPLDEPPDPEDYLKFERNPDTFQYILKPKGCVDLLINTRKHFQHTMKTHPIRLKVPRETAEELKTILERTFSNLPPILFAKNPHGLSGIPYIRIIEIKKDGFTQVDPKEKTEIDPNWVYLRLDFKPSAKLKDIMKYIFNREVKQFDLNIPIPKCRQFDPHGSDWYEHFHEHKYLWQYNEVQRKYATDDVLYLMELDEYFKYPESNYEGELSFAFGSQYCVGYSLDLDEMEKQLSQNYKEEKELRNSMRKVYSSHVNTSAPRQVKAFLHDGLDEMMKILIPDTSKETFNALDEMEDVPEEITLKINMIRALRRLETERRLMNRLYETKRLYCVFKVMGTRTNRESGGDSLTIGKNTINPQGIPKGNLRKLFTFNEKFRQGGDFNQFEVTIWLARYNDKKLNELIKSGKKIHGLWGSYLYNEVYETIMLGQKEKGSHYSRAKNSFFAMLYGAQIKKIALLTGLTIEQVTKAFNQFYKDFEEVGKAQEALKDLFTILRNWNYQEPDKDYIESFLGFQRSFRIELDIMKLLIATANSLDLSNGYSYMWHKGKEKSLSTLVKSSIFSEVHQMESHVQRIAGNFVIQSPGGELVKRLQGEINAINPCGIIHKDFYCLTFNIHDELICTGEHYEKTKEIVDKFIKEYKKFVPFLSIDWNKMNNWSDK